MAVASTLLVMNNVSQSSTVEEAEVRRSIEARFAQAQNWPDMSGQRLVYQVVNYRGLTADQQEILRALVTHPAPTDDSRRIFPHGGGLTRVTLWFKSPNEWRVNYDYANNAVRWLDYGRQSEDAGWSLVEKQLNVGDASGRSDARFGLGPIENTFRHDLDFLFFGGMGMGRHLHLPIREISIQKDGAWRLTAGTPQEFTFEVTGVWNSADQHVEPNAARIISSTLSPSSAGRHWRFHTWSEAIPGLQVCERIEEFTKSGDLEKEILFGDLQPVSESDLRKVLNTPERGGTDPVRGVLAFEQLFDYRPGVAKAVVGLGTREQTLPLPGDDLRTDAWPIQRIGWIVCGVIVVALVVLRVMKR